jgi:hypothetical protein
MMTEAKPRDRNERDPFDYQDAYARQDGPAAGHGGYGRTLARAENEVTRMAMRKEISAIPGEMLPHMTKPDNPEMYTVRAITEQDRDNGREGVVVLERESDKRLMYTRAAEMPELVEQGRTGERVQLTKEGPTFPDRQQDVELGPQNDRARIEAEITQLMGKGNRIEFAEDHPTPRMGGTLLHAGQTLKDRDAPDRDEGYAMVMLQGNPGAPNRIVVIRQPALAPAQAKDLVDGRHMASSMRQVSVTRDADGRYALMDKKQERGRERDTGRDLGR